MAFATRSREPSAWSSTARSVASIMASSGRCKSSGKVSGTFSQRRTASSVTAPPMPPVNGGMVGAITYDAVRRWEKVPDTLPDDLHLPELAMMLATDLAVLDHADGSLLLVANAINYDATDERMEDAWADAVRRLDRMTAGGHPVEPAD